MGHLFRIRRRKAVRRADQTEAARLLEQPAPWLLHRIRRHRLYVSAKAGDNNIPLDVRDGKLYWGGSPHRIITLNHDKIVYKEIGGQGLTFTLSRRTKEQVDPE
jgi:hypothetical protein